MVFSRRSPARNRLKDRAKNGFWVVLSVVCCAIGGTVGLICLSIFDTLRHPRLHDAFLLIFPAGYIISAIFICAEYQRLGIPFCEHRVLRASFWLKLAFILVETSHNSQRMLQPCLVIRRPRSFLDQPSEADPPPLEWIIALIFTFYVFTFFMDLLPAARANAYGYTPDKLSSWTIRT